MSSRRNAANQNRDSGNNQRISRYFLRGSNNNNNNDNDNDNNNERNRERSRERSRERNREPEIRFVLPDRFPRIQILRLPQNNNNNAQRIEEIIGQNNNANNNANNDDNNDELNNLIFESIAREDAREREREREMAWETAEEERWNRLSPDEQFNEIYARLWSDAKKEAKMIRGWAGKVRKFLSNQPLKYEKSKCSICFEEQKYNILLFCNHTFCRGCIEGLFLNIVKVPNEKVSLKFREFCCPICRDNHTYEIEHIPKEDEEDESMARESHLKNINLINEKTKLDEERKYNEELEELNNLNKRAREIKKSILHSNVKKLEELKEELKDKLKEVKEVEENINNQIDEIDAEIFNFKAHFAY